MIIRLNSFTIRRETWRQSLKIYFENYVYDLWSTFAKINCQEFTCESNQITTLLK